MDDPLRAAEAIRQLKYGYLRFLDLKQFTELGMLLTEDCTASYEDGETQLAGRAAIVAWLSASLRDAGIVTLHQAHHPELSFQGDDRASGIWYLEDRVIVPAADLELHGTAFYRDEYAFVDGRWMISHTGYQRVFEQRRQHSTGALQRFKSRF